MDDLMLKYQPFIVLIVVLFLLVGVGKFMSNRED